MGKIAVAEGDDWINRGMDLTINNRFDDAAEIFQKKISESKNNYKAYFYLSATLNSKMTHFENEQEKEQFESAVDSTIKFTQNLLIESKNKPDSVKAELLFYQGSAYGYRAYFQGRNSQWYAALKNGIKANSLLNEALETDSTFYDAYFGIGTYKYWLSSKIKFILWLPFVSDTREEGIAFVKKAIEKNCNAKYMAMHQLIYILIDYGHFDEAIYYGEKVIEKYPESQFMWWAAAHAFFKKPDLENAELAYLKLEQLLSQDKNPNPTHILNCQLKLAKIYYESGKTDLCLQKSKKIISSEFYTQNNEKILEYIKEAKELYQDCRELTGAKK